MTVKPLPGVTPIRSGTGSGDNFISARSGTGTQYAGGDPSNAAQAASNPAYTASQMAIIGKALGKNPNQLTLQDLQNYTLITGAHTSDGGGGLMGTLIDKVAPAIIVGAATAGIGSAVGGALAGTVGSTAGSVVGGAAQGAIASAGTDTLTGAPLTLKSVGGGALSGGLGAAATPLSSGLSNYTGLSPGVSSALVRGGIGATMGGLSGGAQGALTGGVGGAASGLLSNATGSNALGKIGGSYLGSLAGSSLAGNSSGNAGTNYLGGGVNGQGNNGNMASGTDSSLASTITGALPGLLQAGAGAGSSLVAANDVQNADKNAITTQQNNLGNIQNVWSNQQATGQGANTALQSALGLGGAAANYSNFENMPGYQFAVQQGTQAIQRQAASMGSAYTPNTAAAVGQYVTGTAAQDYNTYISQLMGAAGLGTTANQGLQGANQSTANNVSQLQQNVGQAQAYGATGVGNAVGGLFSANGAGTGLLGAAGNYLNGGGGGGGGGGGNGSGVYTDPTNSQLTGTNPNDAYNPGSNYQYDSNGNIIGQGTVDGSGVGGSLGSGVGSDSNSWLDGFSTSGGDGGASDILDNGF
jgi:hypothetical protein